MKLVTITLPFPDMRLNPNKSKGMHWSATSGLRKKAKHVGRILGLEAAHKAGWEPHGLDIPVCITFEMPDRRLRDRDNLLAAMKPSLDGVALALGVDDSQFEPVTLRRTYGREPGAVHIEVGG